MKKSPQPLFSNIARLDDQPQYIALRRLVKAESTGMPGCNLLEKTFLKAQIVWVLPRVLGIHIPKISSHLLKAYRWKATRTEMGYYATVPGGSLEGCS